MVTEEEPGVKGRLTQPTAVVCDLQMQAHPGSEGEGVGRDPGAVSHHPGSRQLTDV